MRPGVRLCMRTVALLLCLVAARASTHGTAWLDVATPAPDGWLWARPLADGVCRVVLPEHQPFTPAVSRQLDRLAHALRLLPAVHATPVDGAPPFALRAVDGAYYRTVVDFVYGLTMADLVRSACPETTRLQVVGRGRGGLWARILGARLRGRGETVEVVTFDASPLAAPRDDGSVRYAVDRLPRDGEVAFDPPRDPRQREGTPCAAPADCGPDDACALLVDGEGRCVPCAALRAGACPAVVGGGSAAFARRPPADATHEAGWRAMAAADTRRDQVVVDRLDDGVCRIAFTQTVGATQSVLNVASGVFSPLVAPLALSCNGFLPRPGDAYDELDVSLGVGLEFTPLFAAYDQALRLERAACRGARGRPVRWEVYGWSRGAYFATLFSLLWAWQDAHGCGTPGDVYQATTFGAPRFLARASVDAALAAPSTARVHVTRYFHDEEFNLYDSGDYRHLAHRHVLIDPQGHWRVLNSTDCDDPVGTYLDGALIALYVLRASTVVRHVAPHVTYGRLWRDVCDGESVEDASCAEFAAPDRLGYPQFKLAFEAGLLASTAYTPHAPRYRAQRV